jgi:lysophospholipase L1-like esterase
VNSQLPIVIVSTPRYLLDTSRQKRYEIVRETYEYAIASGDNNVYYVSEEELYDGDVREIATVDGVHPNDAGFLSMAQKIGNVLAQVL